MGPYVKDKLPDCHGAIHTPACMAKAQEGVNACRGCKAHNKKLLASDWDANASDEAVAHEAARRLGIDPFDVPVFQAHIDYMGDQFAEECQVVVVVNGRKVEFAISKGYPVKELIAAKCVAGVTIKNHGGTKSCH